MQATPSPSSTFGRDLKPIPCPGARATPRSMVTIVTDGPCRVFPDDATPTSATSARRRGGERRGGGERRRHVAAGRPAALQQHPAPLRDGAERPRRRTGDRQTFG